MACGGVGEMLVSAVVKEVMSKLGSVMWQHISSAWGFNADMKEMKKNLEMVQAVLDDAEIKSVTEKPIFLWLKELKSAAYDIEDMMCDFETKIPSNNLRDGWVDRLRHLLIYVPKVAGKRVVLAYQMKEMSKRLGKIAKRRSQFILSVVNRFDKGVVIKERETFSDICDENQILGRDKEKEELLSLLIKSDGDEDVSIIAIVGLGGIGKTTLAQLIYNHGRVKEAFQRQAWAYVSMEFDLKNIGRALLESLGSSQNIPSTLQGLRASLQEKIRDQKCFVVLDDLWEEDGGKLEELRGMLGGCTKGSKILVTTRSENVAMQIRATQSRKLVVLSDDHCWRLFSKRAFVSKTENTNKDLVWIGNEIVKKCGGIPLAAKALGYTMRSKKGIDAWAEVRDSEIWKLEEQSGSSSKTSIVPSLKLSYYFMPSYLKLCFVYCSIFPKGCWIEKDELIQQWIALGFIRQTHEGSSLEKRGDEYINDLLNMSFLQLKTEKNKLVMHDLVHDLARYIIGDELLILDAKRDDTCHNGENSYRYALIHNSKNLTKVCGVRKIRAIYFNGALEREICPLTVNAFLRTKYLRVLHLYGASSTKYITSFQKLKELRYLCARSLNLEVLPEYLGNLKNLRYIDMSYCECRKLPKSFGNLINLRVLKLDGCAKLEDFPEIFHLVSLQKLYISGCKNLRKPPKLSCNQTSLLKLDMWDNQYPPFLHNMPGFVLVKNNSSTYYDVIEFNKVDASKITSKNLEIAFLENVINQTDAFKASFCAKSELKSVIFRWTYPKERALEEMVRDESTLENLMPNLGLDNLIIDGYSAPNFPCNWLLNVEYLLPILSSLCLENLKMCENLPSLGRLPNLDALTIRNMPNLKKLDKALFGRSGEAFRRLRILILDCLLELEEWPTKLPDINDGFVFTHLEMLDIRKCPKMKFEPSFPGSQICIIQSSPHVLYLRASQQSTSLALTQELAIKSCKFELGTSPDIIREMTSLRKLSITKCNNITVIPEWLGELTSLEEFWVDDCRSLNYLPLSLLDLPSIKSIYIFYCNQTLVEWCSQDSRFRISERYVTKDYKNIMYGDVSAFNWMTRWDRYIESPVSIFESIQHTNEQIIQLFN